MQSNADQVDEKNVFDGTQYVHEQIGICTTDDYSDSL
jgi:hypothetical protein